MLRIGIGRKVLMAKLNSSLIKDYQTTSLNEKIQTRLNTVDLNYLGYDPNGKDSFEKYGVYSHINRVLLWLASKPNDYVRESFKGGILWSLLGRINNDSNHTEWENTIKERFNEEFSSELSLMYISISLDVPTKTAILNMVVSDNLNKQTFTVSTSATL